jgi:hypothetical protein
LAMLNTNPASSSELDKQLEDVPLSNISYHVKELLGWNLIEVVSKEQVRGGDEEDLSRHHENAA